MTALTTDTIIQRIADLQDKMGLFPAVRQNDAIGYKRQDINVFLTAITVFTLQKLRARVLPETQKLIDQIAERARQAYPIFQNKDGLKTYNFWPTRPSATFQMAIFFVGLSISVSQTTSTIRQWFT